MSNIKTFQVSLSMLKSCCLIFYLNRPYFHVHVLYISNTCFPAMLAVVLNVFALFRHVLILKEQES